jgi:ribonuclease P protein component
MNAPCRNGAGAIICYATMLPAEQRLRANRDFRLIYSRGRSHAHPVAVLYVMRRTGEYALVGPGRRFGFVVSKKQGGAVVRNRIKRRLREAIRQRLPELRDGPFDVIIVGRSRANTAEWTEIQEGVEDLLRRGNLLRRTHEQNERGRTDGEPGEPAR